MFCYKTLMNSVFVENSEKNTTFSYINPSNKKISFDNNIYEIIDENISETITKEMVKFGLDMITKFYSYTQINPIFLMFLRVNIADTILDEEKADRKKETLSYTKDFFIENVLAIITASNNTLALNGKTLEINEHITNIIKDIKEETEQEYYGYEQGY